MMQAGSNMLPKEYIPQTILVQIETALADVNINTKGTAHINANPLWLEGCVDRVAQMFESERKAQDSLFSRFSIASSCFKVLIRVLLLLMMM